MPPSCSYWRVCASSWTIKRRSVRRSARTKIPYCAVKPAVSPGNAPVIDANGRAKRPPGSGTRSTERSRTRAGSDTPSARASASCAGSSGTPVTRIRRSCRVIHAHAIGRIAGKSKRVITVPAILDRTKVQMSLLQDTVRSRDSHIEQTTTCKRRSEVHDACISLALMPVAIVPFLPHAFDPQQRRR